MGCSLDFTNESGYGPLILASCGGHLELVQWLCKEGCSLQQRTIDGDTALLLACYCGHAHLVEWMLANGGSLLERNHSGLTPLISAANGGHPGVVEMLLASGANMEETDNDGYTALLLASRRGFLPTVQCLAVEGADGGARTKQGLDAVALSFEHVDVREWLLQTKDFSPLHVAALMRSPFHVKKLLHTGAHPLATTSRNRGPTPLDLAGMQTLGAQAYPLPPACQKCIRLLQLASQRWTPSTHNLFGPRYRRYAVLVILLAQHLPLDRPDLPNLPPEIWLRIISLLGRDLDRVLVTTV